jgi:hypothetical protein
MSLKNTIVHLVLLCSIVFNATSVSAQESKSPYNNKYIATHDDSLALEDVIVEEYYIADSTDCADTLGGILPQGSITYRIYLDLRPGYKVQAIYGSAGHEMFIKSTTAFYNNENYIALTGLNVNDKNINIGNVALDSWITVGAATRMKMGIPKSDDKDSSLINKAGLSKQDGLTDGVLPLLKTYNLDLSCFKFAMNNGVFSTKNGAWASLGGTKGPTDDNKVLIAQITTNGKLSFELNVQIETPKKDILNFVAKDPVKYELAFKKLKYNH